jgi:hypothetical protein
MPSPAEVTRSQISRLTGLPPTPTFIGVCADDDVVGDRRLFPGGFIAGRTVSQISLRRGETP